jgi:phosphoribosylanthranilate isomerase
MRQHPFVKTCGITSAADARLCLEAGAWALGLIFVPQTPRCVSLELAQAVRALTPQEIPCIGVFQNQACEDIQEIVTRVGLDAVQLHGKEQPKDYQDLTLPVVKTLFLRKPGWPLAEMIAAWQPLAIKGKMMAWLIEDALKQPETVDWPLALKAFNRSEHVPIWIAGGLTPENVSTVWQRASSVVQGLDVAGGLEASPGVKSPQKLTAWQKALAEASSLSTG